jgi:hypothetical protein
MTRARTLDEALADVTVDLVVAVFGSQLAEVGISRDVSRPTVRPTARVRTFTSSRSRDGERLSGVTFVNLWSSPDKSLRLDRKSLLHDDGLVLDHLRVLPRGELLRVQIDEVRWPYTDLQVVQLHLVMKL